MRSRRLVVWCVTILLVTVPAVRWGWTPSPDLPRHAAMKSPTSSPGGWRTVTTVSGVEALAPVLGPRRAAPSPSSDRLAVVAPAVPFHPPRG
jgi:hypothetical protein